MDAANPAPAAGSLREEGQFQRVAALDRPTVSLSLDGRDMTALEGDTVLTAILVHRRHFRSFEFGPEARAGFCLMGICQDCWLRHADGVPLRACTTLVLPGLRLLSDRR